MKMKTSFFLSAVMAAGLLASCSNSEEVFNEQVTDGEHSGAQLNIVPTVSSESTETRAGFDPKTDWAAGDAMGLFIGQPCTFQHSPYFLLQYSKSIIESVRFRIKPLSLCRLNLVSSLS